MVRVATSEAREQRLRVARAGRATSLVLLLWIRLLVVQGSTGQVGEYEMSLEESIKAIPGEGGFWKSRSEETFMKAASDLSELGMDGEKIIRLLTDLYWATANCYGG